MPRYTVEYDPDLQDDLLETWLRADSVLRDRITKLTALIDRTLGDSADQTGHEVASEPGVRIWLPPQFSDIEIVFKLMEADRKVRVARISIHLKDR